MVNATYLHKQTKTPVTLISEAWYKDIAEHLVIIYKDHQTGEMFVSEYSYFHNHYTGPNQDIEASLQ